MRLGIILLFAALALVPARGTAQEPDRSHWLRVRYQLFDETRGTAIDEETTIFRDGLVVTTNVNRGAFLVTIRGHATRAERVTLRRSLARNDIDEQAGDCDHPFLGGQNATVRVLVTSFDRRGSYHRFAVGRALYVTLCSQGTRQLIDDIMGLIDASRKSDRWQVEEVDPEPPFPFFPCENP